jgi:integrase
MSGRSKAKATLKLSGGLWTPHDLRRTAATVMVQLGVMPEVVERCLNHSEQNMVKRIYQRHSYEPEMKQAWQLLSDRLELLLRDDADNVILLRSSSSL